MKTSQLPSLNAIRAFEVASRHLNFRLAAEELGVSQGAVAQHVRGLEDTLGVMLFDRGPRTLALTEPGRRYASTIRRAFELIVEATAGVRPEPARAAVSVTPTFAAKWLCHACRTSPPHNRIWTSASSRASAARAFTATTSISRCASVGSQRRRT